jgi:hypothetical protein
MFTRGGMHHEVAERGVESRREPAASTLFQRVRPKNDGMTLVVVPFEPGKIALAAESHEMDMKLPNAAVKSALLSPP